ncbi:GtrA family protein, partial [Bifidobacterium longum]
AVAFVIMVVIAFAIIGMQRAMSSTTRQNTHGNHHDNILSQRGYHRAD